jgi:hypothetical protein
MFYFAFGEVRAPMLDQLGGQEIRFVDQQHELFLVLADIRNVLLEVGGIEELWVSGVDYLDQHI